MILLLHTNTPEAGCSLTITRTHLNNIYFPTLITKISQYDIALNLRHMPLAVSQGGCAKLQCYSCYLFLEFLTANNLQLLSITC